MLANESTTLHMDIYHTQKCYVAVVAILQQISESMAKVQSEQTVKRTLLITCEHHLFYSCKCVFKMLLNLSIWHCFKVCRQIHMFSSNHVCHNTRLGYSITVMSHVCHDVSNRQSIDCNSLFIRTQQNQSSTLPEINAENHRLPVVYPHEGPVRRP